jgi:type I restriction enzyme R subunit
MSEAGYSIAETEEIKNKLDNYLRLREIIHKASGETLDIKPFEADLRFLIDNYIQADPSKRIDNFENTSLLELINKIGIDEAINELPEGIKNNQEAVAETIENNIRQSINTEYFVNPAYCEEMSKLLGAIILELREKKINYAEYLKKMASLAKDVLNSKTDDLPKSIKTKAQKALFDNLHKNEELALQIDEMMINFAKADFRGNLIKEREIEKYLHKILQDDNEVVRIFEIIKAQPDY